MHSSKFLAVSALALVLAAPALACDRHQPQRGAAAMTPRHEVKKFATVLRTTSKAAAEIDVPLWPNLGSLSFPVTAASPLAQRYFDQALMLAYGFNHAEARRSFQAAQQLAPECAMCFWGEALVLGPNINTPMDAAANGPALAAVKKAKALASSASARERALIEALARRYSADPVAERAQLDRAYADAMVEVAQRFPDDRDIATLTAEALMDLSPWDYWEPGGRVGKGRTDEFVALLERVLAADPDHPGAIHFYIHAVEASDRPERAEPYADRLARQNLGTGHLAHMPSHIYYVVGRYKDSLEINKKAVATDEAFLEEVQPEGIYAGGYYPHNVHFVMVSAQMAGDGATAIASAEKLERTVSDEVARTVPWVQPIKAAPLFAHAQFSEPERILALPKPTGGFPYVDAMWHYARGVAFAAQGDVVAGKAEAEAIAAIVREGGFDNLVAGGLPAPDILEIARQVLLGRLAQAGGDQRGAISAFEAAVAIEDKLPYIEPPFWYYPIRQSLGAALVGAGELERAEAAFRVSLQRVPNNGWALFGLAQTLHAKGDIAAAQAAEARLKEVWIGAPPSGLNRL